MKIQDYCKSRGLNYGAVNQFKNRNKELFAGHTSKGAGGCLFLDEEAIHILDEQYQVSERAEVVPDNEVMYLKEINYLKDTIITLQKENAENQKALILNQKNVFLLEESNNKNAELSAQNQNIQKEKGVLEQLIKEAQERELKYKSELLGLQEENKKLKNRGLWDRILNK